LNNFLPLVKTLLQTLKIHPNLTFWPLYLQFASLTCTEIKTYDLTLGEVW